MRAGLISIEDTGYPQLTVTFLSFSALNSNCLDSPKIQ